MDDDLSVKWTLANPLTIQTDDKGESWHAGAARDLVALDEDRILVATDTGGVWMVHRDGTSLAIADVDQPDFWCITAGPYGNDHFYAAGTKLYQTDISKNLPLLSWQEKDLLLKPWTNYPNAIYRVLVLREDKKIVLATSDGVVWADIPPAPERPGSCLSILLSILLGGSKPSPPPVYNWKLAVGLDYAKQGYLGLAAGPPRRGEVDRTISVASWGHLENKVTEAVVFYFGEWQGSDLVMKKSVMTTVEGIDNSKARATTMASCAAQSQRMYAISSDDNGFPLMMWKSADGGRQWEPFSSNLVKPNDKTFAIAAGNQGNSSGRPCNCIAVSRNKPDTIAVGCRVGGWFISEDGGGKWWRTDTEESKNTHADVHGIYFDPTDFAGERIFIAHDGGVSMAPKLGADPTPFESK